MLASAGLVLQQLTNEQKDWLAIAICGAVLADGDVDYEELRYLKKLISFLPSKTQVDSLIEAVKAYRVPSLPELKNATRDLEVRFLIEITQVISIDNSLSIREIDYLFYIGKGLGFEREFIRVVVRWANEGILWRIKLDELIEAGTQLKAEYH